MIQQDKKVDPILIDSKELRRMLSCGRIASERIGNEAHARVQIGRRVLWDINKIKIYIGEVEE